LARPHQQRANANANHQRLIYELDERGSRTLRDSGLPFLPKSYHRNFAHELMVAELTASIELGVIASRHIKLVTWPEILGSTSTPTATREADNPHAIPITFSVRDQQIRTHVYADARPFGLQRTIDNRNTYLFFPGIEADCASEPILASDFERSSIYKKFAAYSAIVDQSVYKSHFGFPNFFVPVISTSIARMQSMMSLLGQITEGRGSKIFLFKTFPAFTSFEKRPTPTGHMIKQPWHRVGFAPFFLDR
jgi:hypothetical protein